MAVGYAASDIAAMNLHDLVAPAERYRIDEMLARLQRLFHHAHPLIVSPVVHKQASFDERTRHRIERRTTGRGRAAEEDGGGRMVRHVGEGFFERGVRERPFTSPYIDDAFHAAGVAAGLGRHDVVRGRRLALARHLRQGALFIIEGQQDHPAQQVEADDGEAGGGGVLGILDLAAEGGVFEGVFHLLASDVDGGSQPVRDTDATAHAERAERGR